jgi:hypothetical protein
LCERRRAGFARLSGWQPVGNWVASAGEFSSIPVTRMRYPTTSRESRRAVCAEKWPEAKPNSEPAARPSALFYDLLKRGVASGAARNP